ncbi:hypothetical protein [Enterococcus sp. DIV0876]|uniref:hypothetical protein n=1 Tax=Enterococcus sp. DIV0876 TaxID=2774633 RepID=UPI003D2FBE85
MGRITLNLNNFQYERVGLWDMNVLLCPALFLSFFEIGILNKQAVQHFLLEFSMIVMKTKKKVGNSYV